MTTQRLFTCSIVLFFGFFSCRPLTQIQPPAILTTKMDWLGFQRFDFSYHGHNCILVSPDTPEKDKPWIWRTEFFGHEPQCDSMLITKGFYLAYIDVHDMYGAPKALDIMDSFYNYMISIKKLNKKPILEGFSRGGLYALNWAARNPSTTGGLYLDAPVCDFKMWPGKQGKGPGSETDWKLLKIAYGFKADTEAFDFAYNPVDNLEALARYRIPIISVCGTADEIVPMEEHSLLLQSRYEKLGGSMTIIKKEGVGHHPHSLKDPTPIVNFILQHRLR